MLVVVGRPLFLLDVGAGEAMGEACKKMRGGTGNKATPSPIHQPTEKGSLAEGWKAAV